MSILLTAYYSYDIIYHTRERRISMKWFDMVAVGERIRKLRQDKKWSLTDLANELDKRIGVDNPESKYKILVLGSENGRQTVSQLELGKRTINLDTILALADIFDVSVDYIMCRSDDWQHENKDIKETVGLSDKAIRSLKEAVELSRKNDSYGHLYLTLLNHIAESKEFEQFAFDSAWSCRVLGEIEELETLKRKEQEIIYRMNEFGENLDVKLKTIQKSIKKLEDEFGANFSLDKIKGFLLEEMLDVFRVILKKFFFRKSEEGGNE